VHVALVQLEFHARLARAGAGLFEHRRRGVDAYHAPAALLFSRINGETQMHFDEVRGAP
jgi:hypothetical protein